MFASKMEVLSRPLSDHIWGCRRSKATMPLFGCVIVNVKNKSDDHRCEDVGLLEVWRWEWFLHSCELGSRPFDFLNQKQKTQCSKSSASKTPISLWGGQSIKIHLRGRKVPIWSRKVGPLLLGRSFVALHKRRRGEERFIVMIFCCTQSALDTVVEINLGAVMNIMWRWTKCNSSTQESDASEYYTSHVASEPPSVENNNCVYLTLPAGPWPGIVKVFFLAEINCQISFIIAKICISMVPHHHHHITNTKGFI